MSDIALAPAPVAARPARGRASLIAAGLGVFALIEAVVVLWHPGPPRDHVGYADVAPVRAGLLTYALVDGVSFALVALGLGLAVCLLTPGRGGRWAAIGAVLTTVGGLASSLGSYAYASVAWYATSDGLPPEWGTALLHHVKDHNGPINGLEIVGFLVCSAGTLLLAVALWRSRSVPRWLPIATAALVLAQFAGPQNRLLDGVQALLMVSYVIVAVFLGRRTLSTH